jgi:ligand-binding sensor domain-containing protein
LLKITCSIIVIIVCSLPFPAQIKIHKNISTADGLINNEVRDIYQDSEGYVWFATMGGISRWDGKYFKSYTQNNGLEYFQTFSIHEDMDSSIFFATFGRSIIKINNDQIDTINTDDGLETNFIMKIFNLENKVTIFSGADATVSTFSEGKFEKWDLGLKGKSTVYDLVYDETGNLLIATHDFGLAVKSENGIKYFDNSNSSISNTIWDIKKLHDNSVILGTQNGVFTLQNDKIKQGTKYGRRIVVKFFYIPDCI